MFFNALYVHKSQIKMSKRVKTTVSVAEMEQDIMMEQLRTQGYMVVPGYLTDCDDLKEGFWDYLETMNSNLKRTEPSTWTKDNLPLNTKGLIQHYNVGFQRFNVDAHMKLKPLFETLYGTSKLWASFDGVSFTQRGQRPVFTDLKDWNEKKWTKTPVHIDQTTPGFISVQSGLALTDQNEDQHVFVCIPGSHLHHETLLDIWNADAELEYAKDECDKLRVPERHWQVMTPNQISYLREKGLDMIRVPLNKGDVVLWDSRTVHSSAGYCKTAPVDSVRIQLFVCMRPIPTDPLVVKREMGIRKLAYDTGRVSKHSADYIRLFGKVPRIYCQKDKMVHEKMNVPKSVTMTKEEEELYGLTLTSTTTKTEN